MGCSVRMTKGFVLIQSTLVISKSKGFFEKLRDIRTLTYQICRTEEKINRTTKLQNEVCNLTLKVGDNESRLYFNIKCLWSF